MKVDNPQKFSSPDIKIHTNFSLRVSTNFRYKLEGTFNFNIRLVTNKKGTLLTD